MKEIILNFREDIYAKRLAEFIRKYYSQEIRIAGVFPKEEVKKSKTQLLLTDDWEVFGRYAGTDCCFFDFDNRGEGINPYRAIEGILGELLWSQTERTRGFRTNPGYLIIFYTPGGSSTQKRAALQKSRELGKGKKCLYFPVRDTEFRWEEESLPYDLSELCYCLKRDGILYREQVQAAIEKREYYDAVRGFHSPIHLAELGKEIGTVLEWIERTNEYEGVVLDLQILPPDYKEIFSMADEIYIVEDFETEEDRLPLYAGMENLLKTTGKKTEYQIWRWGEKKDAEGTIEQGKNRTP